MLASLLLLRMTYREGTGPETFSGEDSKPDYRHIESGCHVIRDSTILGMERNRPKKGTLERGMQWECSSLETADWELVVTGEKRAMGSRRDKRVMDSRARRSNLDRAAERSQPRSSPRTEHASWESAVQPQGGQRCCWQPVL